MTEQKKPGGAGQRYVVAKQFTDPKGQTWQQGQAYTGDDADEQARQGNVRKE